MARMYAFMQFLFRGWNNASEFMLLLSLHVLYLSVLKTLKNITQMHLSGICLLQNENLKSP